MGVKLVGVELEGAWERIPPDVIIQRDVSVQAVGVHPGEIPGPPLPFPAVLDWVRSHYPQHLHPTCGMHVHVSLETVEEYQKLTLSAFYGFFLKKMEEWGKGQRLPEAHLFWRRLQGGNRFARKEFSPSKQLFLLEKTETRRTQINFPWKLNGTVECRLFPMFENADLACSAVTAWVEIVNAWVEKPMRRTLRKVSVSVRAAEPVRERKIVF